MSSWLPPQVASLEDSTSFGSKGGGASSATESRVWGLRANGAYEI